MLTENHITLTHRINDLRKIYRTLSKLIAFVHRDKGNSI